MTFLFTWLRIAFGLVFLAAALPKAADPAAFASIVAGYRILPEMLVNPVALLLPWTEAVCGAALVAGAFPRGAALVLNLLTAVFIAALWFNLSRGLDVTCGCFSLAAGSSAPMRELIVRDAVLLVVGLTVLGFEMWRERRRLASAALWRAVTQPQRSSFSEPSVRNGVLVVGDDAPAPTSAHTFGGSAPASWPSADAVTGASFGGGGVGESGAGEDEDDEPVAQDQAENADALGGTADESATDAPADTPAEADDADDGTEGRKEKD